jgi:ankyrin repeat protein
MRLDRDATSELVDMLVRHGAKINLTDNDGNTAIIIAAEGANPEVLKALIDAGADVRLGNKQGQTALMNAVSGGDIESVRLLIQAGADVNARNKDGENVLDQTSDEEIKALLVSFGAEPHKESSDEEKDDPTDS